MPRCSSALLLLLLIPACRQGEPLDQVDARYADVLARLNAADRDVARNIHNRDARRRKKAAEKERVAFFRERAVTDAIAAAREAEPGTLLHTKGEAYWRHAVFVRSWHDDEKERETELLARIDVLAGAEASWSPPEGDLEVELTGNWATVSKAGDELDEELRAELAREFVGHQLAMVGDDLRELVKLRNRVARREGFDTFWHLALYHQGLTEQDVDLLIREIEPVIRPVTEAYSGIVAAQAAELGLQNNFANNPYLRRQAGLEAGRDEAEPYFDTDLAEDHVLESLRRMGIELPGWQVYSGPSRHTRRGAYSFPIRPPESIALVVSKDRRYDPWQYEAIIHEAAHALRWSTLSPDALASPVLWDPPNAYTEGFAQFFERVMISEPWIEAYLPDMPLEQRRALAEWRARQMARWVSQSIVETAVERRVYEDPNSWGAVARYCADIEAAYQIYAGETPLNDQGIAYCQGLHTPLIWHYPAYIQNYIFSYVTEAQLHDAFVSAVGQPVDNPALGSWLEQHITRDGAITSFTDRLDAVSADTSRAAALARYIQLPMKSEPSAASDAPQD